MKYETLRTYVRSFGEWNSICYTCRIHSRSYLRGFLRHTSHKLVVTVLVVSAISCFLAVDKAFSAPKAGPAAFVICDFEDDEDGAILSAAGGATEEESAKHTFHGKKCKKITFPKGTKYPGMRMGIQGLKDFSAGNYMKFECFNESKEMVTMSFRIDDNAYGKDTTFAQRGNISIVLKPGDNKVVIDMNKFLKAEEGRMLDAKSIQMFLFWVSNMEQADEDVVLYMDYLRLEGDGAGTGGSKSSALKCPKGHSVPAGTKFCPECGAKIK